MTFNDWSVLLLRALPDKSNRAWNDVCAERIMAKLAELEDEPKAHCCAFCFNGFDASEPGSGLAYYCALCGIDRFKPTCQHKNIEPTVIGPHTCLTAMRCVDCGAERRRGFLDDWTPCKAGGNE